MSERSKIISKLKANFQARAAYIQAKVGTLVPSQIRALRLKSKMGRQADLAKAAHMHQSRISMFETPGANPTLSTLSVIAAALNVGLVVKFVPFSEMLNWENGFSQDSFSVTGLDEDREFLNPLPTPQFVRFGATTTLEESVESLIFRTRISAPLRVPSYTVYDPFIGTKQNEMTISPEMLPRRTERTPIYARQ